MDSSVEPQIQSVVNFQDLVATPFQGNRNVICWQRDLKGNFGEIVQKLEPNENLVEIDRDELRELSLSEQGQMAREVILEDWKLLEAHGAAPTLNLIKFYERDNDYPFFPTDVYSFHVDRSPVPIDTFLCTYHGKTSEILPNAQAIQKVLVPEIREELQKLYCGADDGFESFLRENFFDLHYNALPKAQPIRLGLGHLCRLAIDHPDSRVLPCVHRAPKEKMEYRLMMIC